MADADKSAPKENSRWLGGISTEPSFRFHKYEPVAIAVQRVILEQVIHALQIGAQGEGTSSERDHAFDKAVHELRKSMKRIRAALRLVRSEIGAKHYRAENKALRNIARAWGPTRDALVLAKLAEKITPDLELDDQVKDDIVSTLRLRAQTSTREARLDHDRIADTEAALLGFVARVQALPLEGPDAIPDSWDSIEQGLERVARRVVRRRDKAVAETTTERLHAWRRVAKYLGYQTELLLLGDSPHGKERSASVKKKEKPLLKLHEQLSELGNLLGDDHDLAVLIETLGRDPHLLPDSVDAAHLFWELTSMRRGLQSEAFEIGSQLGGVDELMELIETGWRARRSD